MLSGRVIAATRRRRRAWSPRALTGLVLWLRADLGITASSGSLSAWADQSGAGNHSTSTSTTKPTVVANAMNGHPVIRFTAASNTWIAFDTVAASLAGSDTPYSLFATFAPADVAVTNRIWVSAGQASTTNTRITSGIAASALWQNIRRDDTATEASASSVATATAAPHVHAILFTGTAITHYVDNTSVLGASALNVGALTPDRFTIGARRLASAGAPDAPANMDMAELFLVPGRVVTEAERLNAQQYLAARYGVTLA